MTPAAGRVSGCNSVSTDVDKLLSPKSLKELETLETQISAKLHSNEPIDVEYWEQLLRNVAVYKSRAELNDVYQTIIDSRLNDLRREQQMEASGLRDKLSLLLTDSENAVTTRSALVQYSRHLDPEPLLKLRAEDKASEIIDEKAFLDRNVCPDLHVMCQQNY